MIPQFTGPRIHKRRVCLTGLNEILRATQREVQQKSPVPLGTSLSQEERLGLDEALADLAVGKSGNLSYIRALVANCQALLVDHLPIGFLAIRCHGSLRPGDLFYEQDSVVSRPNDPGQLAARVAGVTAPCLLRSPARSPSQETCSYARIPLDSCKPC